MSKLLFYSSGGVNFPAGPNVLKIEPGELMGASAAVLFFVLLSKFHSPFCDTHHPTGSDGIRAVDFCNFDYPRARRSQYNEPLFIPRRFRLKNGVLPPEREHGGGLITLEDIQYAHLTGSTQEDAIVTLFWHSGGTMQRGMAYVWSLRGSKPVLLWDFVGGDRGLGGLHRVYEDGGDLIVEIADPDAAAGNCCSRRIIRTRYHWNGSRFARHGKPTVLPNPEYKDEDES